MSKIAPPPPVAVPVVAQKNAGALLPRSSSPHVRGDWSEKQDVLRPQLKNPWVRVYKGVIPWAYPRSGDYPRSGVGIILGEHIQGMGIILGVHV